MTNISFYHSSFSKYQNGIFNLLHIKNNIPISVIIECIDEYVERNPTLKGDRSNTERKRYSKPKEFEKLKKFRLECISYSDGVVDHWGEFLNIVEEKTGIKLRR